MNFIYLEYRGLNINSVAYTAERQFRVTAIATCIGKCEAMDTRLLAAGEVLFISLHCTMTW